MRITTKLYTLSLLSLSLIIASCGGQQTPADDQPVSDTLSVADSLESARLEKVVNTLPSPIQVFMLLKREKVKYVDNILNPVSNASSYTDNYRKALNLGVYGADMSYANLFGQPQVFITCLGTVQQLADGMGLSGVIQSTRVFDRFQNNMGNQDSLLVLTAELFRESDYYLKENKRFGTARLVLAGGWIEGLYISTRLISKNRNVMNFIADQGSSLASVLELLGPDASDAQMGKLVAELKELQELYKSVTVTYTDADPATDEASRTTTLNSTSTLTYTDAQFRKIADKIESIRAGIVRVG